MDLSASLRQEDRRTLDLLGGVALDVLVPSCPGWTAGDLAWHLVEVKWLWATIVEQRLTVDPGDDGLTGLAPRPATRTALLDLLALAGARFLRSLLGLDAGTPLWSWAGSGNAAWVLRRMAHEALVHRLDAQLAADRPTAPPMPALAADGIDELVTEWLTGIPPWAEFIPAGGTVVIRPDDTDQAWALALGRMVGMSPDSDTAYDLPAARAVDPRDGGDATLHGPTAAMHAWLWGRGSVEAVSVVGEPALRDALRALVADATG